MYEKLTQRLYEFSIGELKQYIGLEIMDTLLEWSSDEFPGMYNRDALIKMLLSVHGLNLFKDQSFRTELLLRFSERELQELHAMLSNKASSGATTRQMAVAIGGRTWGDNKLSRKILEILEINPDVLNKKDSGINLVEKLQAEARFFELLDYQFFIKQQVLFRLQKENSRMLVHMPTGTGKTKTAMHTICHYINFSLHKQGLILWIAHSSELLEQAYETFAAVWRHLGSGDICVYRLWGKDSPALDNEVNGIVFCSIQKLMSIRDTDRDYFEKLHGNCRLIAYDEAHKASAEHTKGILEALMVQDVDMPPRSLLGLTATPGRSTEFSESNTLLSELFEDRLITIDIELMNRLNMPAIYAQNADSFGDDVIGYFQKRGILSRVRKEELTYETCLSAKELTRLKHVAEDHGIADFSSADLQLIGRNRNRNRAILKRLLDLAADQTPTIVFACGVVHAQLISAMLTLQGVPNALVLGEMEPAERALAIRRFKDRKDEVNILVNYEVLTTGFDATNIECVFITRPTKSIVLYSQMIGRGLRGPMMGGNEECLLIDVRDNITSYDVNLAFSHFNDYWRH